ncbi:Hypothetical protein PACV_42 [Pacmanvirus A23]|uniref:Hypothetical protein n=1 Tax=Pacmanvirus A23 TaxID=1932881 RepID=UPI000A09233A|nr:Hypothetical protein B9W72_gp042 [Pacmanvirus A23]SIP85759.1 Hypothetical protein PACV_42 [Pacmanvirus A23]
MSGFTYQLNAYYGIHYPIEHADTILAVASRSSKFSGLASDESEARAGKCTLFISTNSDADNAATRGFVFVDEMTFGGPDEDMPENTFVNIEPSEMEKREKKYESAVNAVTDLYDLLVKEYRSKKMPLDTLYLGWSVTSCTWDLSDDSDDSENSEVESSNDEEKQKSPKEKSPKSPKQKQTKTKPAVVKKEAKQPEVKQKGKQRAK